MKRLLSFLFVLFMCSPSLSQNAQNVIGLWKGTNDSCKSFINFEKNGKFRYVSGDSKIYVSKEGTWKLSVTHWVTLITRRQESERKHILFKRLDELAIFILSKDKNTATIYYGDNIQISFKKIDGNFSIREDEKSPQNVITKKKGIVI